LLISKAGDDCINQFPIGAKLSDKKLLFPYLNVADKAGGDCINRKKIANKRSGRKIYNR
jgi:hypothetical protein